jgi:site-specific recombinase XerD
MSTHGVNEHLRWLTARRCSGVTVYNRRCALQRLARWSEADPLDLEHDTLYRWQCERAGEICPASQRTEMVAIRQFYLWAVREQLLDRDPTARLLLPRAPRGVPRPAADVAVRQALAAADEPMGAIIGLARLAGLRACEIARLDWSEVGEVITVDGKGGHTRQQPVSEQLAGILDCLGRRRGPVIARLDGSPGHCLPHTISQRAGAHLQPWGITLHQLRHAYITAAYRAGRDLRAAQHLAGHASPTTTAGYAAAATAEVERAALAAGQLTGGIAA